MTHAWLLLNDGDELQREVCHVDCPEEDGPKSDNGASMALSKMYAE